MKKLDAAAGAGNWMKPGMDSRTIGRQIVGNAYRDYLGRDSARQKSARDAIAMNDDDRNRQIIEDAYQAAQERKTSAWKEGSK